MTKVKICGITNLEDALVAVEAGADLLGFIFYEPSPRYVTPETVRDIVAGVRGQGSGATQYATYKTHHAAKGAQASRIPVTSTGSVRSLSEAEGTHHGPPQFIGVFVNAPLEVITGILDYCRLDAAQLHGDEPPEFVNHFKGRAFKALRPRSPAEAESLIRKYRPCAPAPAPEPVEGLRPCFLLDAYHPTLYGGTGYVTDWTLAASVARQHPIMLAGSLTPANVAEAIRVVKPWGVDVSSGVEVEKGKKDHKKIRAFVRAVKGLERET